MEIIPEKNRKFFYSVRSAAFVYYTEYRVDLYTPARPYVFICIHVSLKHTLRDRVDANFAENVRRTSRRCHAPRVSEYGLVAQFLW